MDGTAARCNADMDGRLTRRMVRLDGRVAAVLAGARERGTLSGRGHDRVLRVARTIADLAGRDAVRAEDVDEALSYRFDGWERLAA
jgi:magnesium chelatase family protein